MSITVGITTSTFAREDAEPLDLLMRAGIEWRLNPYGRKLQPEETVQFLDEADGVIAGTETLNRAVLGQLPKIQVISRVGVGLENVDLAYAEERGIQVFSTSDGPTQGVAELALGGLLAVSRGVAVSDAAIRRGEWTKPMGHLLQGKTVGLIGLGRIGRAFAVLVRPFAVSLIAFDLVPDLTEAQKLGVQFVGFEEILVQSDVVSLHLSGVAKRPMLGEQEFLRMKPGAVVVNTARGGWLDEKALAQCLRNGHLGGAYLDVFEEEPYRGPLAELPNVVLTPHIGSYAAECRVRMEAEAASHVVAFFGARERKRPEASR
ncbi:MAG: phosphoglycerate dehydrogenase [Anaerolineales bacterium]|jgi:D-3-phosphoglycerate dehydrogenase